MNLYRIRELRLARALSQEQLAELCSLSVRTIQRIENGEQASLETLSAIAAVMDLKVGELYCPHASQEQDTPSQAVDQRVIDARKAVEDEMAFVRQLLRAVILCAVLFAINWFTSPLLYVGLMGGPRAKHSAVSARNKSVFARQLGRTLAAKTLTKKVT